MTQNEGDLPGDRDGAPGAAAGGRHALFIVGSGRSGTSTLAGTLQRLGMWVPQPEVPADATNPRGFAEPQWLVDLHDRLLERANVTVADARPQAWLDTADVGNRDKTRARATRWLARTCTEEHPEVVLKDPRLGWFLGLWRGAALRTGVPASYAVMLRPPEETIGSKQTYYSATVPPASRAAGWLNHMLHVERATRGHRRSFVLYHDLLEDWTVPVFALGERHGIVSVQHATAKKLMAVHDFVDPSLRRVSATDRPLELPTRLEELMRATWEALVPLTDPANDDTARHDQLDELRRSYLELYREAEEIAASTAAAQRRTGLKKGARRALKGVGPDDLPADEEPDKTTDEDRPAASEPVTWRRRLRGTGAE